MGNSNEELATPEWLILIGAVAFILVLAISAYWEPQIRLLHFFQAWMYVATIALSFRRNRWGHFVGISTAGFWNYLNLFAVSFFFNGLQQTGQVGSHGKSCAPRHLYCSARMVLESVGLLRMRVGLFATS